MYGNYNMGAGFAVYVNPSQVEMVIEAAKRCGFEAWNIGVVEEGERRVVIESLNITFEGSSLGVRST